MQRASLTEAEANDARHEIETTREAVESLEAMLTLQRQQLRPMWTAGQESP